MEIDCPQLRINETVCHDGFSNLDKDTNKSVTVIRKDGKTVTRALRIKNLPREIDIMELTGSRRLLRWCLNRLP